MALLLDILQNPSDLFYLIRFFIKFKKNLKESELYLYIYIFNNVFFYSKLLLKNEGINQDETVINKFYKNN